MPTMSVPKKCYRKLKALANPETLLRKHFSQNIFSARKQENICGEKNVS